MINLQTFKQNLELTFSKTRENLNTIRTGRASPAIVENMEVTTYGGGATLKIIELATIMNNGPQDLVVTPFDPSTMQDIEKKLRESSMGFSVVVQGNLIRLKMPPLSEEQREKYAKLVSGFIEDGREFVRKHRDEIRKELKSSFENKEITEDEKYRQEEAIEKVSKEYNDKLEELKKRKEQEIMTI